MKITSPFGGFWCMPVKFRSAKRQLATGRGERLESASTGKQVSCSRFGGFACAKFCRDGAA